jgi:hypothetical protein
VIAVVGEAGVGDVAVKVLAHIVFPDHPPDGFTDAAGPAQGAAGHPLGDGGQIGLGRLQEFVAFACAFGREGEVAAGDQPFPGEVGIADLGQILGIEQADLQPPLVGGEFGDRRGAQRGDPPEPGSPVGVSPRSAKMRAEVIMPRSPTSTSRVNPKRSRITSTMSVNTLGSAVLLGNTRTATGRPAGSVSTP